MITTTTGYNITMNIASRAFGKDGVYVSMTTENGYKGGVGFKSHVVRLPRLPYHQTKEIQEMYVFKTM